MSFSLEVKEELEKKIDTARHCQIAEFAAFMGMSGNIHETDEGDIQIEFMSENEVVLRKFFSLLHKIFGIHGNEAVVDNKSSGEPNVIRIVDKDNVANILMTLKWFDEQTSTIDVTFADKRLIQKECCKRAFIRGAFLVAGSISDPNKFYHYEIVCRFEEDAEILKEALCFFGLDAKITARKNSYVVYLKEANNITDVLVMMGAMKAQMELVNIMILKGISNDINRKVNCETANLNKTIEAAVKQTNDIMFIRDTIGLDSLKDNLREIAYLRLDNPDVNLKDLGEMLDPPVGKSGVNHRLRKISEMADELRGTTS